MRYLELVGAYAEEFADHCKTLPSLVCADCGVANVTIINTRYNSGVCKNRKCKSFKRCIALAPSAESVWGESGNTVLAGGTGEQKTGVQSASGKMWELHRRSPKGCSNCEPYEMRIYPVMQPEKAWLRADAW
jgi:hypothetical protein